MGLDSKDEDGWVCTWRGRNCIKQKDTFPVNRKQSIEISAKRKSMSACSTPKMLVDSCAFSSQTLLLKKLISYVRQKVSVSPDMFWAWVVQTETLSEAAALTTRGVGAPLKRSHPKVGGWYNISGFPASEAERKCLAYTPGDETLAITGRFFLKMIDKPQSDDFIGIIFSWLSIYPGLIFLAKKHFSKIIL